MTTVTLRIAVDKSGASENIRAVKGDLGEMGTAGAAAGQQASQGVNGLSSALQGARQAVTAFLAVYAGIQALSGVVRLADEYQGLSDRLRLATTSAAEFEAAQSGVFAIAQESGAALGAVSDLYVRLANSTRSAGLSQGELLTITQSISQAMAVSGTSAVDAERAITQLSQAFQEGRFRGDEFNSIATAAPRIMDALAASLGTSTDKLRGMAEAGTLTAEVLARGLLQQAPQIASDFDRMGETVGRAFNRLSNAVLQFVGEASQSTGAANALAIAITAVANVLPAVITGITALAVGYGTLAAAALVANPAIGFTTTLLAGLATALGVVTVAILAFKLGEYLANEFEVVRAAGAYLVIGLNAVWEGIKNGASLAMASVVVVFTTAIDSIQERLADLLELWIEFGQTEVFGQAIDFTYGQADALAVLSERLRESTDSAATTDEAIESLRGKFDESTASSQSLSDGLFEGITAYFGTKGAADAAAGATARAGAATALTAAQVKDLKKAQDEAATAMDSLTDEINRQAAQAGGPLVTAYVQLAGKLADVDEWEVKLRASNGLSRAEAELLRTARLGLTDALVQEVAALNATLTPAEQHLEKLREEVRLAGLVGAARAAAVIQSEAETTARGLLTNATDEQVRALADEITALEMQKAAADASGQAAEEWGRYWGDALGAATDAFGDFVASGFKSFEDFGRALKDIAKRIISDLVSQFLRSQIVIPIQTAISGGGGLGGAFAALTGTTGGTLALIGGAIAALAAVFSGDQETILRVRSQQFNGDRQARGVEQSALGNIFVRGESLGDGAAVEVAAAIRDFDNIIAGFLSEDQLALVRTRLNAVNDTFRDGSANVATALDARFGAILSVLGAEIQAFVGTAGPLEDRVQRLADAMVITSAAATGLISDDFGEVAGVLERFRAGGEGLDDTFGRIVSGMSLVDDALLLMGGAFRGTRLQAANFSGELIALSGGFEQFSSRINGALETLFTDDERNQFLAQQSQSALNTALTDLNISGTGIESIRNQLRDALRAALESGNAALVDQILTAANALGAFGTAVEALGEDAVDAANATAFGSTGGLTPRGGLNSDAGTSTGGASTPIATQLQASQAAARALERHTGLLEQIAANTRQGPETVTGEKSARDSADAGRASAATLREIKALIETAIRAQAQESIKTKVGANNRAAA